MKTKPSLTARTGAFLLTAFVALGSALAARDTSNWIQNNWGEARTPTSQGAAVATARLSACVMAGFVAPADMAMSGESSAWKMAHRATGSKWIADVAAAAAVIFGVPGGIAGGTYEAVRSAQSMTGYQPPHDGVTSHL